MIDEIVFPSNCLKFGLFYKFCEDCVAEGG